MKFSGEILAGGGGGHVVIVPPEIAQQLTRKNARVLAVVNGIDYHARVARYAGKSFLGLRKDLLRGIGVDTGDTVEIELTEEAEPIPEPEPKPVETPELTTALTGAELRADFDALPAEHRREYLRWIAGTDDPAARAVRIAKLVRRLGR